MKEVKDWMYINSENVKGLLGLGFATLLLLAFIYSPMLLRSASFLRLPSKTTGIVDTLIQIKGIYQSDMGNKIITNAYHIYYHYEIDTKIYKNQEIIQREAIPLEDRLFLSNLAKGDTITVKHKETNPSKSKILISK